MQQQKLRRTNDLLGYSIWSVVGQKGKNDVGVTTTVIVSETMKENIQINTQYSACPVQPPAFSTPNKYFCLQ